MGVRGEDIRRKDGRESGDHMKRKREKRKKESVDDMKRTKVKRWGERRCIEKNGRKTLDTGYQVPIEVRTTSL